VYPHGENAHEFEVYVKLGMSPLDDITETEPVTWVVTGGRE
jgi:hypothetical protein